VLQAVFLTYGIGWQTNNNLNAEEMFMKKTIVTLIALTLVFGTAVCVSAANGQPGFQQNFCAVFQIYPTTSRTIEGTVVAFGSGGGMTVDNGTAEITIFGIGPVWYWGAQGIDSPDVGDTVIVDARDVEFLDGTKTLAVSITIDDQTIQLRDPETGCPLWRGGKGRR